MLSEQLGTAEIFMRYYFKLAKTEDWLRYALLSPPFSPKIQKKEANLFLFHFNKFFLH